jgi:GGDEF domain-containing protein/putative methionine-R-sulfoxide reductase with GAF domain
MRKRIVIAGTSREGLELLPLLESNPAVEVCALLADDPDRALADLERRFPATAQRLASRVTSDVEAALATPGLVAVVDAEAPAHVRARLARAHGIQVLPPQLARMLYAFGPADAMSKSDLLQALRESLDSYDLTHDRRGLLRLVLQIAVTATGADRGSLMLWDERERVLRVEVAIGIEDEVIPKIRVQTGEGIAGRAFASERSILLHGKADRTRFDIVRERDDVESAISAPLAHAGRMIGVLNLSHARHQNQFGASELAFVDELARLDARIIARAEEFHGLVRESQTLRAETDVRRLLARDEPLARRLTAVCAALASQLRGGVCQLYLRESESESLHLQAASTPLDPLAAREHLRFGQGLPGRAAELHRPLLLGGGAGDAGLCYAALPLLAGEEVVGVLAAQGERTGGAADLGMERLHAAAEALADELAGALRSARNERDSRRAARLSEVVAAFGACQDEHELAEQVSASAVSLLEAQDAVLRLREEPSGRFRIAAWSGVGEWRKAALAELERKLATEAMRARRLVRVADLAGDPAWSEHAIGVGTAMIAPLLRDGRAIGCLSVLGKVPDDPLLGERFGPSEERILAQLAQHAQVALAGLARPERGDADPVTGLLTQRALRERLEAELARSRARGHSLVLTLLRADGLEALREPSHTDAAERAALALAQALRATLRDFDVVARPEPNVFATLVPEPDGEVSALLVALYRAAREALDSQGEAARALDLRVGYAVFPQDGADADSLERAASERRVEAL